MTNIFCRPEIPPGENHLLYLQFSLQLALMITVKSRLGILSLLILFLTAQLTASTDNTPHRSPCDKFQIVNMGGSATFDHHFELRRSDGTVLFSYRTRWVSKCRPSLKMLPGHLMGTSLR